MNDLFQHVGGVTKTDTFDAAMGKIRNRLRARKIASYNVTCYYLTFLKEQNPLIDGQRNCQMSQS